MRRNVIVSFLGIMFLFVLCLPICATGQTKEPAKPDSAKELFEKKCSTCHKADRATSKIKTQKEWDATVMRMINARGAKINDADAKIIIDYLAANYGKEEKK